MTGTRREGCNTRPRGSDAPAPATWGRGHARPGAASSPACLAEGNTACAASPRMSPALESAPGFWDAVRVPRFRHESPRILIFSSGYFLEREIAGACKRLGWRTMPLPVPSQKRGSTRFVEALLCAALAFKPDFALTVNHLGLDRQGELLGLFARMNLPLASWFVDSPRLILHDFPHQQSPYCAVFSWDKDTVAPLVAQGFEQAAYLPLATDTTLFAPSAPVGSGQPVPASACRDAGFVGDSMQRPVARLKKSLSRHPQALRLGLAAARAYAASPARDALSFLRGEHPELLAAWESLPDAPARLDLEQLITWEATRLSRLECVRALLPCAPVIAGDSGWKELLAQGGWTPHAPLDYYRELPGFYRGCRVNVNATSLQMKGAVNQRVFDVPACGAFLLTDRREQLQELFEPERESVCYSAPEEIPGLVRHYLARPAHMEGIAQAARARVLADHDYTSRMRAMYKAMRRRFA